MCLKACSFLEGPGPSVLPSFFILGVGVQIRLQSSQGLKQEWNRY